MQRIAIVVALVVTLAQGYHTHHSHHSHHTPRRSVTRAALPNPSPTSPVATSSGSTDSLSTTRRSGRRAFFSKGLGYSLGGALVASFAPTGGLAASNGTSTEKFDYASYFGPFR